MPLGIHIPRHLIVAGSAWVSRIVMALVQLASVRILMDGLGLEQYAVFALLTGLAGWYVLADMGIGVSLQNYISECRAKEKPYDAYLTVAAILAILLLVLTIGLLYLASPYLAPLFLKHFTFMSNEEKAKNFFVVGALLIGACMGSMAYKIWYAEQKGYWSNILPTVASLVGLGGIVVVNHSIAPDKLYFSLVAFIAPTALFPLLALAYQFAAGFKNTAGLNSAVLMQIIKRAGRFWFFAIMAAAVLQIDYVVMSQFLQAHDIAAYNISTKIFGLAFFIYGSILGALWPVFAEAIAKQNWQMVRDYLRKYLILGLAFMLAATVLMIWLIPKAVDILAPSEKIIVPLFLIILLGIYQIIRVWTDTFTMVLQSMSDLRPFWIYVPIQALISVGLQWALVPIFGLYGIVFGLIGSFVLTVSWALPLAVRRHYRVFKQVTA